MSAPEQQDLLRQFKELRNEIRGLRRWMVCTAISLVIILLTPQFATFLTEHLSRLFELAVNNGILAPVLALLIVFVTGAVVVSHFSRNKPRNDDNESTDMDI
jgi:multisubunit Na+/H+ antiporter MnhB subunit